MNLETYALAYSYALDSRIPTPNSKDNRLPYVPMRVLSSAPIRRILTFLVLPLRSPGDIESPTWLFPMTARARALGYVHVVRR